MNFYKIPETIPLQDPIDLSKELFSRSWDNFDGDIDQFNGDPKNNFTMYAHNGGLIQIWKPGIVRKLLKVFTNIPIWNSVYSCTWYLCMA